MIMCGLFSLKLDLLGDDNSRGIKIRKTCYDSF